MILSINKNDLIASLTFANKVDIAKLIEDSFLINGTVSIKKGTPVGNIYIELNAVVQDGEIELSIVKSTVAGMNLFGVVKTKARGMILDALVPYENYVHSRKIDNGNIRLAIPNVVINTVVISDSIIVDLSLKNSS